MKSESESTAQAGIDTSAFLRGIDVSEFQGEIDWTLVEKSGIKFVFIKATEGIDLLDPTFATNWAGARQVEIPRSAYHLFRPKDNPQEQVDFFVKSVGTLSNGDLPPMLDLEVPADWVNIPMASRMPLILAWVNGVKAAMGVNPIIYCNQDFVAETLGGNASALSGLTLYLADNEPTPHVPNPWKTWTYWQYSDAGRVSGVPNNVDLDYYNGTALTFKLLTGSDSVRRRFKRSWWSKILHFLGVA